MGKNDHDQLYSVLMEMNRKIGNIESKVESIDGLGKRVVLLETFVNTWKGKIAVITVVLSFAGTAIWQFIKSRLDI